MLAPSSTAAAERLGDAAEVVGEHPEDLVGEELVDVVVDDLLAARVRSQAAAQLYCGQRPELDRRSSASSSALAAPSSNSLEGGREALARLGQPFGQLGAAATGRLPATSMCSAPVGLGGSSSSSTTRRSGYSCSAAESSVLRTVGELLAVGGDQHGHRSAAGRRSDSSITARGTRRCARVRYSAPCRATRYSRDDRARSDMIAT